MDLKIYHNPRCSKSRAGLKAIEEAGKDVEIVKYLDETPSFDELKELISKLGIKPIELVRITEKDWRENYKGKDLSDDQVIQAMIDFPRLIERPIVVRGNKAVIGRPLENIINLIA